MDAAVLWEKTIALPAVREFRSQIQGQLVLGVSRRGKFILIQLESKTLLIHLRMSGDLRVEPVDEPPKPHDRLLISFYDRTRLVFNDTRKFGRVWLVDDPQEVTGSLGLDPFDEALTPAEFFEMLHRHHRRIKTMLFDQTFLAGLGNIYSDEALFRAGIHPMTVSSALSEEDASCLLNAIRSVLTEGIERNGASIDWVYRGGTFQNHFNVYQRTGQPCLVCSTPIQRKVVGQRGTHFCPHCQRLVEDTPNM
jgi:formamidopyrimidine-DNA glycosylase